MNAHDPTPARTLFDEPEPTGAQLRDIGVATVLAADAAIHRGYRPSVERAVDALIAGGTEFSADDVWTRLPKDVRDHVSPNVISAVFRVYANRGVIRTVGVATSTRPRRRRGLQRTWVGVASAGVPEQRRAS